MTEGAYCCEAAAAEPMAGTADPVDGWLLLEYRPAWRARSLEDNDLAPAVRAWLEATTRSLAASGRRARLQFVRQPERDGEGVTLFVAERGSFRRIDVPTYEALTTQGIEGGVPLTAPHYFVCTNSARDRCCGRFGLPLYAALRERVGARVWQTTHVGGHRFAPNVLVLPSGRLYGRVHAASVESFADVLEGNGLGATWLRGCSFDAPAVQAAETLAGVNARGATVTDLGADACRVHFASGATIDLALGAPVQSLASCGDAARKPVRSWRTAG